MQGGSSACPEGVLDVGIIVPACFDNPLRQASVEFISDVLTQKRNAVLPVPAVIGAYHIVTRYLRVPKVAVKRVLEGILITKSPALCTSVQPEVAAEALDYAAAYGIESWDGYLISLARSLGAPVVYSLDQELAKVKEVTVVNPFPSEDVRQYHKFLEGKPK